MRASLSLLSVLLASLVAPPPALAVDSAFAVAASGDSAYNAKRFADAVPLYRQVVTSGAPARIRANAQMRIGYAHYLSGNKAAAKAAWQAAADQFPDQPRIACESLLRVGNLAIGARDYASALSAFQRAVNAYSKAPDAAEFAAEAACRVGSILLRFAEDHKLKRVPNANPELAPAYYGDSQAAFERVVRDFPSQKDWVAEASMQLVALKLESAIAGKAKYADAQTMAEKFLSTYPDDLKRVPTVRIIRAESLFYQNLLDEAIAEIGIIQSQYPDSGQPAGTSQFLLGQCFARQLRYEDAIDAYRKFLDEVTVSFSAWEERPAAQYGIGMCLRSMGKTADALKELSVIRASYPTSYYVGIAQPIISDMQAQVD